MSQDIEEKKQMELPENAFRELKEGEEYTPVMSPGKSYPEINLWSVSWGVVMAVVFSAAAAFLGLKVGQVFEAAITRRKRHHSVDRSLFGCDSSWCYLHIASTLHSSTHQSRTYGKLYGGIPQLATRWYTGNTIPHTI